MLLQMKDLNLYSTTWSTRRNQISIRWMERAPASSGVILGNDKFG